MGNTSVLGMVLGDDNPLRDSIDQTTIKALVSDDLVTANCRMRLLAERGDANAQVLLGALIQDGCGTTTDGNEAAKWYQSASEQGHPVAQVLLANRYRDGEGVPKDPEKMWVLYQRAADQRYAEAYYGLAVMHFFTSQPELIEAYKWAKLAAAHLKNPGHKDLMISMIGWLEEEMTIEQTA
jgi:TPR repeat protein